MQIIWYGQSTFHIVSQDKKNGYVNLVIDPPAKGGNLKLAKLKPDILLSSGSGEEKVGVQAFPGNPFLIETPGEYDIKNIFIQGIPGQDKENQKTIIYTIEAEGLKLTHLGSLGQKELTDEQVEKIGTTDILMVPVGGGKTLNSPEATKIINQVEPRIIIPMSYSACLPVGKASPRSAEGLDKFLKTMGLILQQVQDYPERSRRITLQQVQPQNKLMLKKKDLPQEMKVVVLEP